MKQIVLGITGASGACYARRLTEVLLAGGCGVHVIVSDHGRRMLQRELGIQRVEAEALVGRDDERLALHDFADVSDPLSSGSVPTDGMAVCPCSANTLAAIAAGLAGNLITRAAHVHLKQRRRLVLVPREMPVSTIELDNQLRLSRAGAVIAPACPGFYLGPKALDDLVDFVAARVAECLGVRHDLDVRYRP
jgi:4-hydroxy-3-polyprenylbenzoate decarboxylase